MREYCPTDLPYREELGKRFWVEEEGRISEVVCLPDILPLNK